MFVMTIIICSTSFKIKIRKQVEV